MSYTISFSTIFFILIWEINRTIFIRWLIQYKRELWLDLGKPSGYFLTFFIKAGGFKLEQYVFQKKYVSLGGGKVKLITRMLFFTQFLALFFIMIFLVSVIVNSFLY